ncbi:MAG: hypothetical protein ACRCU3_07370 [Eubacteriaceae bacterium]
MKPKEKKSEPIKKEEVEIDMKKIFFTPPKGNREKFSLFLLLLITFMLFFGPIVFSNMHPVKAILLSALPAISISWGWIVFLRSQFQKKEYSK